MITTARVIEDLKNSNTSGEYNAHLYRIEIPLFKNPGINNSKLNNVIFTATVCCDPSTYEPYRVGDLVYVGFINNRVSFPVILGKILKYDDVVPSSFMYANSLKVDANVILPINTTIKSSDGDSTSMVFLKQKFDEIETLKEKVDELNKRIKELENGTTTD